MHELEAKAKTIEKYKRRRRISQIVTIFGLTLLSAAIFLKSFLTLQYVFAFGGFLILIVGLFFYDSIFGTCPICKKRFRFHEDYHEVGQGLFKPMKECPFCLTKL